MMVRGVLGIDSGSVCKFQSLCTRELHLNQPFHEICDVINVFISSDGTFLSE